MLIVSENGDENGSLNRPPTKLGQPVFREQKRVWCDGESVAGYQEHLRSRKNLQKTNSEDESFFKDRFRRGRGGSRFKLFLKAR